MERRGAFIQKASAFHCARPRACFSAEAHTNPGKHGPVQVWVFVWDGGAEPQGIGRGLGAGPDGNTVGPMERLSKKEEGAW